MRKAPLERPAVSLVEEILVSAATLSGVGICLYDHQRFFSHGGEAPIEPNLARHFSPFCRAVRDLPEGRAACMASDVEEAVSLARRYRRPFFHTCHAGITELVVPIAQHEEMIATLFCGQCRLRGETRFSEVWRRVETFGADRATFEELFNNLPGIDRPRLLATGTLLDIAFRHLIEVTGRAALEAFFLREREDHVAEAIRYMERAYMEDIGAREVAAHVHLHQSYLTRLFHRRTGYGISQYLAHLRVEKARALLRETDIPVQSIAMNVGFADPNYFSRKFRQLTGSTPSDYRQQAR